MRFYDSINSFGHSIKIEQPHEALFHFQVKIKIKVLDQLVTSTTAQKLVLGQQNNRLKKRENSEAPSFQNKVIVLFRIKMKKFLRNCVKVLTMFKTHC